jgi:hypothetical protein
VHDYAQIDTLLMMMRWKVVLVADLKLERTLYYRGQRELFTCRFQLQGAECMFWNFLKIFFSDEFWEAQ